MHHLYRIAACIAACVATSLLPASVSGQSLEQLRRQAELVLGRPISNQEALRLLQQSGLSSDQVRELLVGRGYPSDAADPYLAVLEGLTDQVPGAATPVPLIEALTGTDIASRLVPPDTIPSDLLLGLQGLGPSGTMVDEEPGPPIFGRDIFRRATTQFRPMMGGPAPADYRVGPDDELILVVTGDVELAYRLIVSREGWVAIPDVGRVDVNGLTITALRERFARRLAQVYSGITGDANATTFIDVSLGTLRTNLVYVIGEVERPGAYEISAFASVFEALYSAGGPNRGGSFRRVMVNRGRDTRATVDLYDYLLDGRGDAAPRLQQGDVLFVPVAERRVEVDGAIVRPSIYELLEGDVLTDVLEFAGGLTANASAARVQIERVLPPEQQRPGLNRVLLDIPITGSAAEREVSLVDGDRITVFAVLDDLRNSVRITGGVWRPGSYGVEPGMRLSQVLERAGGLLPDAYEGRVQIQRLQEDYTRRMIQVGLESDPDGKPLENPVIEPLDQIYVFARRNLREQRAISIGGWVREPGVYPHLDGMTVRDLILRAGGLRTGAYLGAVDIARVAIGQARNDTITRTFTVTLDSTLVFDVAGGGAGNALVGGAQNVATQVASAEFVLQNLDAVYVRKAPGFEPQRRVVVTGEVMFPGPYSLQVRTERLTDLIARAGGLTGEAYAEGLQLWRSEERLAERDLTGVEIAGQAFGDTAIVGIEREAIGVRASPGDTLSQVRQAPPVEPTPEEVPRTRVGVDYIEALSDPQSSHNILVEPSDSVYVPRFIATVDVRGAVQAPTKVLFRSGAGAGYYIRRAGGYQQNADKGRTRVQLANGEVLTRGAKFLFFGGGLPEPDPGSVVTVPAKPPKKPGGITFAQLATVLTGILTATATIIIATK
jgi:protein involved in polysaccharide export with SLBB domain